MSKRYIGKDACQTKIYQTIKDSDNMPEKLQEKALKYLDLIVKSHHIYFCDEYDLRLCFKWHTTRSISAGDPRFWLDVEDYLTEKKAK